MIITARNTGNAFIEIVVENDGSRIIADVTDLNGELDEGIIYQFEEVLRELKEYKNDREI